MNTENANFYAATALPGSQLYWTAKAKGWELPKDFAGYSFLGYDTQPLPTNYLTPKEVIKFRDNAWQKYFTNPAYVDMIGNKFGVGAKQHVQEMTNVKLKRKILGD